MNRKLLLFFLSILLLHSFKSFSVCTLTAKCTGGNWSSASTWTAGSSGCSGITAPTDGCIIIIPACANVTVDINSPVYNNMEIYVDGTLTFGGGQKINMCPGYIKVSSTGQLTGGTPGSKINICGATVYNGGSTAPGPFELGGGTTLPVELLSFNAFFCDKNVDLEWVTASETNNDYFKIERTKDGSSFETVSTVNGAGNSTSIIEYEATDHSPYSGLSYYRLAQTDYDGTIHYSPLVVVNSAYAEDGFSVYPNPAEVASEININLNFPGNREVLLVLKDMHGKEISSKLIRTKVDKEILKWSLGSNALAGTYLITVKLENKIYSKKLIIK